CDDDSGDCTTGDLNGFPRVPSSRIMTSNQPSLGFIIVFLLFSLLFFRNTYKLWLKTDAYYQDIYNSLAREPSIYPFRQFFLRRMENKQRWVRSQKIFSLLGLVAVIAADVLVVMAYVK
ncbi:MAG TPA: hypothetical protein VJ864_06500, partial [Candidatus Binatia bacterium]|nr:hypothetical protein [Candidatus Binatia bacterium]